MSPLDSEKPRRTRSEAVLEVRKKELDTTASVIVPEPPVEEPPLNDPPEGDPIPEEPPRSDPPLPPPEPGEPAPPIEDPAPSDQPSEIRFNRMSLTTP